MFAYHIELSLHKTSDRDSHKQNFKTALSIRHLHMQLKHFGVTDYHVKCFSIGIIELSLHKTSDRDSHKQDFYTAFRTAIYTKAVETFWCAKLLCQTFFDGGRHPPA